ncbi:MAG: hypothetical protein CFE31_05185 [Rhizobiales bacterium PAR1]|nr:MAG: hypothetical protein CFE31_05185 [Rhizobiales bacterium PAR1]
MKKVTLTALAAGIGLMAAMTGSASAQFYPRPFLYGGYYAGRIEIPAPMPRQPETLDTSEIMDDLAQQGYRPVGVVSRRADVVIVDAISPRNTPVRLVVDAYDGEILERFARESDPSRPLNGPDARKRDQVKAPKPETRVAEIPLPPRRPAAGAATLTPSVSAQRPAPVAPARDPSQWAPLNSGPSTPSVPVAPLE